MQTLLLYMQLKYRAENKDLANERTLTAEGSMDFLSTDKRMDETSNELWMKHQMNL